MDTPSPPPDVAYAPLAPAAPRSYPFVRAAAIAGALVGLGFCVSLRSPVGLVIGLYFFAALLAVWSVVELARRRLDPARRAAPMELALGRGRVLRGRSAWLSPLALFAALTLVREGALGPDATFDVQLVTRNARHDTDTNSHWTSRHAGTGAAARTAGARVQCVLPAPAGGAEHVTRGMLEAVRCSSDAAAPVTASITLNARDAWCYTPLVKSATVPFDVQVDVSWHSGGTSGSGHIALAGRVSQTSYGVDSCRAFNRTIGALIGRQTARAINAFLSGH